MDPLLGADNVRIDAPSPIIEQLTVTTTGTNVVVLGAPRILYEACAGVLPITSGTLRIAGLLPADAVRRGLVASAPSDVALPPRWTVFDLARESARLAGHPRKEQTQRAREALRALQLDGLAQTRFKGADAAVKHAALVAAALATGAETLVVEDFTSGLPDAAARSLARLFVVACKRKRWILFAGQLSLSSPLGLNADEALLFAGGRLVCAGAPADIATRDRTFSLRTGGEGAARFAAALRERGVVVESDALNALTVTLPENFSTLELVAAAHAGKVVVLELLPVSGALV